MMIEIKWPSGQMRIDTEEFLRQPKIAARFRGILKLSKASDLLFGTYTVPLWRGAIAAEKERLQESARLEAYHYQRQCDALRREYENPSLPFHEQMEQQAKLERGLKKQRKDFDKQMGALNRKYGVMEKLWGMVQE